MNIQTYRIGTDNRKPKYSFYFYATFLLLIFDIKNSVFM